MATHCTEADVSKQHIEAARAAWHGHGGLPDDGAYGAGEKLVEQAKLMESYGAECVYVTDSAGVLLPAQYAERVNVDEVVWGRLTDAMRLEEGASLSRKRYVHPRIEPELAFLLRAP